MDITAAPFRYGRWEFTGPSGAVIFRSMTGTVTLPSWLFVLLLLFAVVTFASHFLFPSVRWFFRKRAERFISRINQRLARPIEPFKLARRFDMIQRLIYDTEVNRAIHEYAEEEGVPEQVAFERARDYAREIVPSFSAITYFSIGIRLARWLSKATYRVKLGEFDREALSKIREDATVVFVMNHRSNMDYVLVTWLVSRAGAMSYAVGEWARVWPLSALIKMMGAYFIRRKSRGGLYRKVLARYVQMATENGVTQAMFPEGGLSLDGRLAAPKLGLLNYIASVEERDVIFVPVAVNYDRVLEDRTLIGAAQAGTRRFATPFRRTAWSVLRHLWQRLRGKWKTFGSASVSFGRPLSLQNFRNGRTGDVTEALAADLMTRIAAVVPILPVPLVANELLRPDPPRTLDGLRQAVARTVAGLKEAEDHLPVSDPDQIVTEALAILRARRIISDGEEIAIKDTNRTLLDFYANSIAHRLNAQTRPIAQTAEVVS